MDDRIATRLIAFRKYKGLSQKKLAELAGVSVTTINHIENGRNTDLEILEKIEKALGIKLY